MSNIDRNQHKIIAVYGNSGSYKTSVSVNLAKAISQGRSSPQADSSASVAVVGLDATKPLLPLLFPKNKTTVSLGRLMGVENLEHDTILSQVVTAGNISFIGYNRGENIHSHAFPTPERIDDFLMQIRHLYNYTIIDCGSDVSVYKMTAKTLINADNVLYLISADNNGLNFCQSQEPILLNQQYGYSSYVKYLTESGRFIQDIDTMKNSISGIRGFIPYSQKLAEQWNNGDALKELKDAKYNKVINGLAAAFMKEEEYGDTE